MNTHNKKISFVVHYPYQWYIYRPIWRHIDWAICEVIIDLRPFAVPLPPSVQADIEHLLVEEDIPYRVLSFTDYFNPKKLADFFSEVEVLVSCWERGCMDITETAAIKKVNTTYGIAKELTLVRPSRSICDLILAYGPRDQAYFSLLTKSVAVGNPRFDEFYQGVQAIPPVCRRSFDSKRPVLLYAPGHGDLGSLASLYEVFRDAVVNNFYVLLKPHYFTLRDEAELISRYAQLPNVKVVDDATDLIGVLAAADVVLTDTSSLIFDALQARKPLVVTDFLSTEYLDVDHKILRKLPRGFSGASTYADSLEQVCKREGKLRTIATPQELLPALQQYQIWHAEIKPVQERLVAALFSFTDGTSGSRAAAEIQTLFVNPRNHQPGILAHAYLAYKNRFSQLFLATKKTVSSVPVQQVVVIDDVRVSEEDRVMTLESARGSADRVLLLSPRRVTYEGVTVAQTFVSVQDWLQQDRQVLFIGVGATVPTLQESQLPTVQNAVHCFSGTTASSPFMPIKRKILGLQKRGGVSLKLTGCTIDAPNHFCTDIQAVLLSGKFFCDYYPINQPTDFGQFPLSIYHHLAPVATFVLYPFLLDRTRTDDVYLEQQMSRYGRLVSTAGYQVWYCHDLKPWWLVYLLFTNRRTLRLAVIKMNALLWRR